MIMKHVLILDSGYYAFDRDILGRVTNACDSLSVVRAFLYNQRSEVTGATIGTNSFGYVFDPIGNRISTTENTKTTEYLVNSLNQYSQISVSSVPPWLNSPAYDADGNMLSDGVFTYAWDAENRLVSATPLTPVSGSKRVLNRYDWQHRLIQMNVQVYVNGAWHPHETRAIVYDGWLPVLEITDRTDGTSSVAEYFWATICPAPSRARAAWAGFSPSASTASTTCRATTTTAMSPPTPARSAPRPRNTSTTRSATRWSSPVRWRTRSASGSRLSILFLKHVSTITATVSIRRKRDVGSTATLLQKSVG